MSSSASRPQRLPAGVRSAQTLGVTSNSHCHMPTELEALRAAVRDRDEQIAQLRAELEFAEEMFNKIKARVDRIDDSGLPVPRLELRWIGDPTEPEGEWEYNLVVNRFTGTPCFYPLGNTDVSGGVDPYYPNGRLRLSFRDGAHIKHDMKQLHLPAFAIRGSKVENLDDA